VQSQRTPIWLELVQLVPVVTLALPFIVAGKTDLSHAGVSLLVAALLTLPVTGVVLWQKGVLNPILVGTALWLWVGAAAFQLPIASLASFLGEAQGFGLFLGVAVVGVATTFLSSDAPPPFGALARSGFIGARHPDAGWVRRSSLILLALAFVALGCSWVLRHDIRLGGGLPFIALNVVRRVIVRRGARASSP
jgi:hypothetical protein